MPDHIILKLSRYKFYRIEPIIWFQRISR